MKTSMLRLLFIALPFALLFGCGKSLSGKYHGANNSASIEFKSGKAYITDSWGNLSEANYDIDGDRIILHGPSANIVLTRNSDGTISDADGKKLLPENSDPYSQGPWPGDGKYQNTNNGVYVVFKAGKFSVDNQNSGTYEVSGNKITVHFLHPDGSLALEEVWTQNDDGSISDGTSDLKKIQ